METSIFLMDVSGSRQVLFFGAGFLQLVFLVLNSTSRSPALQVVWQCINNFVVAVTRHQGAICNEKLEMILDLTFFWGEHFFWESLGGDDWCLVGADILMRFWKKRNLWVRVLWKDGFITTQYCVMFTRGDIHRQTLFGWGCLVFVGAELFGRGIKTVVSPLPVS